MTLFRRDVQEQGVYIDYMTPNTSFLKMAIHLNELGIKNNTFFLALHDKDLIGKDPHNLNDDSLELRQRIAYECKINYWYFIREVVRIVSSGSDGIPFKLNRANLAQAWLFLNSVLGFLTMPRQIGKTIGMVTIAVWYNIIAGKKTNWGMFCNGSQLQWDNVKRFKEIRDALPKYLWFPSAADSNNKEGVHYAALDTQLQTFLAQADKQAADRLGRGATLAVESWDEIAYFVNNHLSWSSAKAAMNRAAPAAREAGLPATAIITTTAGDIDDKWGAFAYKMVTDAVRFTEKFYDVNDVSHLKRLVDHNSKNGIVYMEYSYKQLGMDDKWFAEVTRSLDEKTIEKDYLNHWLHGSDNSLFKKDILEKINASKADPVTSTMFGNLIIRWYVNPDKLMKDPTLRNKPYAIGCDTSDNVGKDFTTLCIVDPYDLKVIATIRCSETNLVLVAQLIAQLVVDLPRSIFIPERNKNGAFMVDYVILEMRKRGINPLKRIFNKYYQEYDPDRDLENLNYDSGLVRKNFGFTTTAASTSRDFLYSRVLMTALKLAADRICDEQLVLELCGLTTKNGRIDHNDSGHDDTVISYLLACFFILFASNHKFYGVDVDEILCSVRNDGQECTLEEKKARIAAKAKLMEFEGRLKRCTNEVMRQAFMREIQNLKAIIGPDDDAIIPDENNFKPISSATTETHKAIHKSIIRPDEWIKMSAIPHPEQESCLMSFNSFQI